MLNKLLKRCMPWQQRGKWVRIYVDWSDTSNAPVVNGPDWLNVSVVDMGHGEYDLTYDPDDYYWVSEFKIIATAQTTSPALKVYITNNTLFDLYGITGYVDMFMYKVDPTPAIE